MKRSTQEETSLFFLTWSCLHAMSRPMKTYRCFKTGTSSSLIVFPSRSKVCVSSSWIWDLVIAWIIEHAKKLFCQFLGQYIKKPKTSTSCLLEHLLLRLSCHAVRRTKRGPHGKEPRPPALSPSSATSRKQYQTASHVHLGMNSAAGFLQSCCPSWCHMEQRETDPAETCPNYKFMGNTNDYC